MGPKATSLSKAAVQDLFCKANNVNLGADVQNMLPGEFDDNAAEYRIMDRDVDCHLPDQYEVLTAHEY